MIRTRFAALGVTAQAPPPMLAAGTPIALETAQPLSSKVQVKGDLVELRTTRDILADGALAVPKGARAIGQIADARIKGAMGMGGRLTLRPLYLTLGSHTVRLTGAIERHPNVSGGAVVGLVTLGAAFTGRSAVIPAGTPVDAVTINSVAIDPPQTTAP